MKASGGKLAAIAAAVEAYMEEEAAEYLEMAMPTQAAPVPAFWRASGRQESMFIRSLWQLRRSLS